ncbi:MAG: 2-oxoacid:ferredoxin oxidoreductase subunit beta [Bacillota bacterium]
MPGTPSGSEDILSLVRVDRFPHLWCAGCGHGIVLGALVRAIVDRRLDPASLVVVAGIGCAARAAGYLKLDGVHATHGRAIAFATGIKLARPELKVIVITGDGDLAAIGGNHFIHAARRNIGLTVVCFNNSIYGMTSGQYSPMTPRAARATTAPYGHIEKPFDLCELAAACGATYVARGGAYNPARLTGYIASGLDHRGFAFIEAVSQCPTYFGRRNRLARGIDLLKWQKEAALPLERAASLSPEEREGRFTVGVFRDVDEPEYTEAYDGVIALAGKKGAEAGP